MNLSELRQSADEYSWCRTWGCTTCGSQDLREALDGWWSVSPQADRLGEIRSLEWPVSELNVFILRWMSERVGNSFPGQLGDCEAGRLFGAMSNAKREADERREAERARSDPDLASDAREMRRQEGMRKHMEEQQRKSEIRARMEIVLSAACYAARQHRDQRRKDAEASPYINHPLALAKVLVEIGRIDNPQIIAAALLHDTVEDTDTSIDEIRSLFGDRIAAIVSEVTDNKGLEKHERKLLQIASASSKSHSAKLVKLADKICNLRDILESPPADWPVERRLEYFAWSKQVVDNLRGTNAPLERAFDEIWSQGMAELDET